MRNILIAIAVGVTLALAMVPSLSWAQYYYPYYYYPGTPPPPAYQPNQGPGNPFLYRLAPNPRVYRQWNNQIRIWDFQEYQRSPLNPESSLEYMLRTF
ncbi:MAG: hypothetical protein HY913_06075 [Desulfomonile tiedjei]|nr:hypothetical protein [Desulfomonile tiedjei]